MRLHKISSHCYECRPSEICPYGVEVLLMSNYTPVAAKFRDTGRIVVSDRALEQQSHGPQLAGALERWGKKDYEVVSYKELDALADDLRV